MEKLCTSHLKCWATAIYLFFVCCQCDEREREKKNVARICTHVFISVFAVGHFIRTKNNNNIRNLYIDFDNTGENLRLITMVETYTNSEEVNTFRWLITLNGHIFILLPANFNTKAPQIHSERERKKNTDSMLMLLPFSIHSTYSMMFSFLIITFFVAVIEQHAVHTHIHTHYVHMANKDDFYTIFIMD